MRFVIDTEKLKEYTLSELGILLILYDAGGGEEWNLVTVKDSDIKAIADKMAREYKIRHSKHPNSTVYALSPSSKEFLQSLNETLDASDSKTRFVTLADKLRQLYPDGKKPGLQEYWRDSTNVIAERLRKFFEKYGEHSDEDIIEATKKYVAHFNGNYKYMKLLKYFIWKHVIKGGDLVDGRMVGEVEKESELLSYIQNLRENPEPVYSADWDITLK